MIQIHQIVFNVSHLIHQNNKVVLNVLDQITVNQQDVIQNMFLLLKMVQDFALNVLIIAIYVNLSQIQLMEQCVTPYHVITDIIIILLMELANLAINKTELVDVPALKYLLNVFMLILLVFLFIIHIRISII